MKIPENTEINNISNLIKYKLETNFIKRVAKNIRKDSIERSHSRLSSKMTFMIIWISLIYIVGNFPTAVTFILSQLIDTKSLLFQYFFLFSNAMLFSTRGVYIFIYFNFNRLYRNMFKRIAKKLLRLND